MTKLHELLSKNIKKARQVQNITQEYLAEQSVMDPIVKTVTLSFISE